MQHELLQQHQIELMEKPTGINALLEQGAQDDLSRMYRLFKEVEDGVKHIAKALRDHVKQIGVGYIEASKEEPATPAAPGQSDDHDLVKKLIALHDTYLNIVKTCMASDTIVEKALREAFEDAINREHYTSNLLAKFVNALLTKGSKVRVRPPPPPLPTRIVAPCPDSCRTHQVSVATFEQTLDHVVMLYGYIRDKDIFEEEYQMYLANRLLASKSESHQAEKTMIAKLKSECGYHWTSKLESMFKDVQLSDELMQQFVATCGREFQTELHVNVCTMGRWPSAVLPTCNMPAQLKRLTDRFKMFYVNKHSGKKIEYQMDKGEADVSVRFADADPSSGVRANAKLLVVSTFQMVILLMYNQRTEFTFQVGQAPLCLSVARALTRRAALPVSGNCRRHGHPARRPGDPFAVAGAPQGQGAEQDAEHEGHPAGPCVRAEHVVRVQVVPRQGPADEGADEEERRRRPQAADAEEASDRCGHRPHHEDAPAPAPQPAGQRGHQAAAAVQAGGRRHQEAGREPHRAGVPRAGRRRQTILQLPGVKARAISSPPCLCRRLQGCERGAASSLFDRQSSWATLRSDGSMSTMVAWRFFREPRRIRGAAGRLPFAGSASSPGASLSPAWSSCPSTWCALGPWSTSAAVSCTETVARIAMCLYPATTPDRFIPFSVVRRPGRVADASPWSSSAGEAPPPTCHE